MDEIPHSKTFDSNEVARLREDYLRSLAALSNHHAKIKMHENIKLTGIYKGCHPDGSKLFFTNTHVPMSKDPCNVLLRKSDIISVSFSNK